MEQTNVPTISVLMAVFNENDLLLREALGSILAQTYSNWEFVVIDDGSTHETCKKTLEEFAQKDRRIKITRNERNLGLTASLNFGIKNAQGKYIARIDSDDISHPSRLEKQLAFMEENPQYALCGSYSYLINSEDEIIGKKEFYYQYDDIRKNILRFNFFTHSALFFRTTSLLEVNGYTPAAKKAQDYDIILKIASKSPVTNIPEFLCFYRVAAKSISEKSYKSQEWHAVKARFRAVFTYGYKFGEITKIIIPLFSFLFIPTKLKKRLIFLFSQQV